MTSQKTVKYGRLRLTHDVCKALNLIDEAFGKTPLFDLEEQRKCLTNGVKCYTIEKSGGQHANAKNSNDR